MTEPAKQTAPGKGKAFFDRGDQVAETGNWDFAIEMYLEGIQREPDNLDRGHRKLYEVGLKRKAQKGKPASFMEQMKRKSGKDQISNLVNAVFLLAKDPANPSLMEGALKASSALNINEVTKFYADRIYDIVKDTAKPNRRLVLSLVKAYHDIRDFSTGTAACELARQFWPDDAEISDLARDLSAKMAIKKSKLEEGGDITNKVRDFKKQQDLMQKDSIVQEDWYLREQITKATAEYEASPTVTGKINALVDALLKTEEMADEQMAMDVLQKAFRDTNNYQYKVRLGDVKIHQMTRLYKNTIAAGDKASAAEQAQKLLEFELVEYQDRAVNYPTDLTVKFELGRLMLIAKRYDEAIPALQQAQRDPRRHVHAMNYLARAFAEKGMYREAADTLEKALTIEMPEDRAKDLRYNLGDVLEKMGQFQRAQDQFSIVAQLDYMFKDVRTRLDSLRGKTGN